jgi:hypothetical protein
MLTIELGAKESARLISIDDAPAESAGPSPLAEPQNTVASASQALDTVGIVIDFD